MSVLLILIALIPGVAVCYAIFRIDKYEREPFIPLLICFLLGAVLTIPAVLIEKAAFSIEVDMGPLNFVKSLVQAFLVIGLNEELLKFAALALFAFRGAFFNEPLDGIVYAVMIAMGFASAENLIYAERFGMDTAVLRVFTAIPAHLVFALAQGYYAGLAKFRERTERRKLLWKGLLIAALLHGTYDLLILQKWFDWLFVLATTALYLSLYYSFRFIREHRENSPFK